MNEIKQQATTSSVKFIAVQKKKEKVNTSTIDDLLVAVSGVSASTIQTETVEKVTLLKCESVYLCVFQCVFAFLRGWIKWVYILVLVSVLKYRCHCVWVLNKENAEWNWIISKGMKRIKLMKQSWKKVHITKKVLEYLTDSIGLR